MVKLTVLYNLPEGANHEEFIAWRTGEHQAQNAAAPGVVKTDFYIAKDTPLGAPRYRYITEAYYKDMDALYASFFTPEAQAQLQIDVQRIHEPVFLVSEEGVTTEIT